MRTVAVLGLILCTGVGGLSAPTATNDWFALDPAGWSVDALTRQWTGGAGADGSLQEVDTNAVAMLSQENSVSDGVFSVSTDDGFLVYRPEMASTNDANAVVIVDFVAKFNAAPFLDVAGLDQMPEGGAQGGLSMRRQEDGTVIFAGLDYADGGYVWRDLSGIAVVDESVPYCVRLVRTFGDGQPSVAYFVKENGNYVQLDSGGVSVFRIPSSTNSLSMIGFRGIGEVAGVKSVMTVEIAGIGVIVIPPDGGPGEAKIYPTVDAAIAAQGYGSSITVQRTLSAGSSVTLAPGITVTFAAGQTFGEGSLIVRGPEGVDYYDVINEGGRCALVLNGKARPKFADEDGRKAIEVGVDGVTLGISPDTVKSGLYYGARGADSVTGVVDAVASGWVRAEDDGKLSGELKAPKFGTAGFYDVTVTDDPRVTGGEK